MALTFPSHKKKNDIHLWDIVKNKMRYCQKQNGIRCTKSHINVKIRSTCKTSLYMRRCNKSYVQWIISSFVKLKLEKYTLKLIVVGVKNTGYDE